MKCKSCKKEMKECGFERHNRRYECECGNRFVPFKERHFGNNFLGYPAWSKITVFMLAFIFMFSLVSAVQTNGDGYAHDGYFAGSFNGVSSVVDINNNLSNVNNISVIAWINRNNINKASDIIISTYNGTTAYGWLFTCGSGTDCAFRLGNGTNFSEAYSGLNPFLSNTWNFVVGTYNGSQINFYTNGDLINSTQFQNLNYGTNTNNRVSIGTHPSHVTRFNGSIDKVQIFNRSLSQAEITQLYNNGQNNPVCNLITDGQVLCIDFDDWSLADRSGNSNNGINTNVSFSEIQGNYRTLLEGIDYTLDASSGLLTIGADYLYSWIMVGWDYYETGNDTNASVSQLILIFIAVGILSFIFLIINYYIKEMR